MARKGGNPDLQKHQFQAQAEPLTKQMQVRITKSTWEQLQQIQNWQQFVRDAISEKLDLQSKQ